MQTNVLKGSQGGMFHCCLEHIIRLLKGWEFLFLYFHKMAYICGKD